MVHLDPSGHRFAYPDISNPDRFKVIDFENFREVFTLSTECGALSPTGQVLDGRGWLYFDQSSPDKKLPMVSTDWSRNYMYCFSPDGRFFAQGTEEGVLIISEIAEVRRRLSEL